MGKTVFPILYTLHLESQPNHCFLMQVTSPSTTFSGALPSSVLWCCCWVKGHHHRCGSGGYRGKNPFGTRRMPATTKSSEAAHLLQVRWSPLQKPEVRTLDLEIWIGSPWIMCMLLYCLLNRDLKNMLAMLSHCTLVTLWLFHLRWLDTNYWRD